MEMEEECSQHLLGVPFPSETMGRSKIIILVSHTGQAGEMVIYLGPLRKLLQEAKPESGTFLSGNSWPVCYPKSCMHTVACYHSWTALAACGMPDQKGTELWG